MNNRKWFTACMSALLIGALVTGCGQTDDTDQQSAAPNNQTQTEPAKQTDPAVGETGAKTYPKAPDMKIDQAKTYTATVKTNKGDFKISLFDDKAPITVNNFVFLAQDKFYDGVVFHRIIKDFMIQTGDPLGNGRGGPGYRFQDELPPAKQYAKGIVAMANAGPNTNGSQFFIGSGSQVDALNRMPNYTVFGEVVEGMDVVDKIASTPVGVSESGETSKPTEEVKINTITIEEK